MANAFDRIKAGLEEAAEMDPRIVDFVAESNRIEGIYSVSATAISATEAFLALSEMTVEAVLTVQSAYAPNRPLRNRSGMNVGVGSYVAPMGGRQIEISLMTMIGRLNKAKPGLHDNPWKMHVEFERLHPFMDGNGRTGRVMWAWHMKKVGLDPFALPFLHRFYYQTLESDNGRLAH